MEIPTAERHDIPKPPSPRPLTCRGLMRGHNARALAYVYSALLGVDGRPIAVVRGGQEDVVTLRRGLTLVHLEGFEPYATKFHSTSADFVIVCDRTGAFVEQVNQRALLYLRPRIFGLHA